LYFVFTAITLHAPKILSSHMKKKCRATAKDAQRKAALCEKKVWYIVGASFFAHECSFPSAFCFLKRFRIRAVKGGGTKDKCLHGLAPRVTRVFLQGKSRDLS